MKILSSTLSKLNSSLGIKFFYNSNTLNNNFFNYLYKKNIISKDIDDDIKKFDLEGYLKPKIDSSELCDYLSKQIQLQNPKRDETRRIFFQISHEMKLKIKSHIQSNFGEILNKFEKYYNNKISIVGTFIKRNYFVEDENYYNQTVRDKSKEYFNMYFHTDSYTINYFKLFISISDIDSTMGPLNFYPINYNKSFLKKSKYKSRLNYKNIESEGLVKNISKKGESIFISTPQCLHKAGIPDYGKHRDVLCIILAATHENINTYYDYEKNFNQEIWNRNGLILKNSLSKPYGFRKSFALYKKFLKSKIK